MSEPHDQISDELISAYLDGELDSQQRAGVEQLLDSEPRYQQMLEELRTLRETLQSLPRGRLDAGFQERVLRMAEQRSVAAIQVAPASKSASGVGRGPVSRGFLRGLFWAAAAVAAAVLLAVVGPQALRDNIGPVALNERALDAPDSTPSRVDRDNETMLGARAPRQEERRHADGSERADAAAEALDEPTKGATGYGVRARSPKGGRETLEMEASPSIPDDLFDATPIDALKRPDAQPEIGVQFDSETPLQSDLKQAAGAASGGIGPVEAASVAGSAIDTSSAELRADAVIHIRLPRAEKNPEVRLSDTLVRNQIAVVRQEPAVGQQRKRSIVQQGIPKLSETQDKMELEERTRKERAVYFTNQAAVDLALVPTEVEVEPAKLYLVQAPVTQIAAAVNQLQQEGGTVLAALPGPRPEAAPLPGDTWNPADPEATTPRPNLQPQKTPGSDAAGQSVRSMSLKRTAESTVSDRSRGLQAGQPSDDAVPALDRGERNWGARTDGRDRRPIQLESQHAGESVSSRASSPSQTQQRYQDYPYRTVVKDPQELQKQLVGLTAGRGGERPLQFLIVLHGQESLAPAVAETAEPAPTTAEPAADAAPSDPP